MLSSRDSSLQGIFVTFVLLVILSDYLFSNKEFQLIWFELHSGDELHVRRERKRHIAFELSHLVCQVQFLFSLPHCWQSCHHRSRILCWHLMWNVSNHFVLACRMVRVSDPYRLASAVRVVQVLEPCRTASACILVQISKPYRLVSACIMVQVLEIYWHYET